VTVRILVNEVGFKWVGYSIDVFAGMVKVKLLQGVGVVSHDESAARCVIDHDGVAVVDDAERYGIVVKLK
jgi:hypothetical protein